MKDKDAVRCLMYDKFMNIFLKKVDMHMKSKKWKTKAHNKNVLKMWKDGYYYCQTDKDFYELQIQIESYTREFEGKENKAFEKYPAMVRYLIQDGKITAKDYLKQKNCGLSEKEVATKANYAH